MFIDTHDSPAVLKHERKNLGSFAGGNDGRVAASWITEGSERVNCHLSENLAPKWSKEERKWIPKKRGGCASHPASPATASKTAAILLTFSHADSGIPAPDAATAHADRDGQDG